MNTHKSTIEQNGVKIVVSQATVLQGMTRTRLRVEAQSRDSDDVENIDRQLLRSVVYPDLIAPVIEVDGIAWPLSFESFLQLPETLIIAWEQAVYDLNPHWQPRAADDLQEKKQQTPSRPDSSNGTRMATATQASYPIESR